MEEKIKSIIIQRVTLQGSIIDIEYASGKTIALPITTGKLDKLVELGNNPNATIENVYEIIDKETPGIKRFFGSDISKLAKVIFSDYLVHRVDNWIYRLNKLFDNIESWLNKDYEIIRSQVQQRPEELLAKYVIPLREVPTLTIIDGRKRVGFVPSALWVIGANGRVNITTNTLNYMLIDFSVGNTRESDWRVVQKSNPLQNKSLSEILLREIINGA